ncbi:MAG: SIR2 family protein [Pseudomonadota bacterium]
MAQLLDLDADNTAATKFLESYIQSGNLNFLIGSGASSPAIKVAGTIEADINKLLSGGKEPEANVKSLDFILDINKVNAALVAAPTANIAKVASDYAKFISCVDQILFARKNILLPRQANIFTTNYDMFIEYAANGIPTVMLNDGFDRSSALGSEFRFAPEKYFDRTYRSGALHNHQTEIPTINLIKLHGSVSWRRSKDTVVFDLKPVKSLSTAERADTAKVAEFLQQHFLILPNLRKFHTTLMERTYYDLLRLFSKAMDQQNVVLIAFGFSFADEHLLDITRRALRNPTSHLVIISYDRGSSGEYQSKFAQQRNVTIVCPNAATKIDFDRLNAILTLTMSGQADAAA